MVTPQSTISEKNMESEFKYHLTHKAEMDLENIISYISVELSNPQAASKFADKLQTAIEEARKFPESGLHAGNEFLQEYDIRKKLVGNYTMYYLPDFTEKMVYILRIVYSRRNMDEILRKLNID